MGAGVYSGVLLLLLLGLAVVFVFCRFVPYNMDEFLQYHPIICRHYRFNDVDAFPEVCRSDDLDVLNTGLVLPLKSYKYVGSLPSLYYYPLFLLWKSPASARFMGVIFLIIQSLMLSRISNIRAEYIFLGLIGFFAYFFSHIVDTGPVGFQITSVYALYLLAEKWSERFEMRYLAAASILVFLGIWVKLSYLWLLPGIALVFCVHASENRGELFKSKNAGRVVLQIAASGVIILAPTLVLLYSTSPLDNRTYLNETTGGGYGQIHGLQHFANPQAITGSGVFRALINPFEAAKRIYFVFMPSLFTYAYDFFVYFTVPAAWLLLYLKSKKRFIGRVTESATLYIAFAVTFIIILFTKSAWTMHHTVLSFPFLVLSFMTTADCLREAFRAKSGGRILASWLLVFLLFNGYFFLYLKDCVVHPSDDFSKARINGLLGDEYLSKNYFYVIGDWGMYYYQGLYGSEYQSVFPLEAVDNRTLEALAELSGAHNRRILVVYNTRQFSEGNVMLSKTFSLRPCALVGPESVWNVMLEEDQDPENICFSRGFGQ